ncbi:hypothetical protein HK104_009765 [Borealophlyctis nickersoniae]|nr:hypothetical protein HK104_009765 [Borealophlyctis nickersoniae]
MFPPGRNRFFLQALSRSRETTALSSLLVSITTTPLRVPHSSYTPRHVSSKTSSLPHSSPNRTDPISSLSSSSTRALISAYIQAAADTQRRGIASKFNFDTYKLVRQLERQGFTRGQAVAIMRTINALLVDSTLSIRSEILSKTDLENQTYLYKAHLQELRNELQLLRQNDSATLKADTETIMREVEGLNQKFSEMIGSLKAEISMDINNHKTEGREIGTDTDLAIQEIHHRLVIKLSDLKTKIETMKVETTRIIGFSNLDLPLTHRNFYSLCRDGSRNLCRPNDNGLALPSSKTTTNE